MEDDAEETGQGGMTDDLMSRGREAAGQAMNDPETRDRIAEQAHERFGNVPGVDQAVQAFGARGGSASDQSTGRESTAADGTDSDTSAPDDQETGDIGSSQY